MYEIDNIEATGNDVSEIGPEHLSELAGIFGDIGHWIKKTAKKVIKSPYIKAVVFPPLALEKQLRKLPVYHQLSALGPYAKEREAVMSAAVKLSDGKKPVPALAFKASLSPSAALVAASKLNTAIDQNNPAAIEALAATMVSAQAGDKDATRAMNTLAQIKKLKQHDSNVFAVGTVATVNPTLGVLVSGKTKVKGTFKRVGDGTDTLVLKDGYQVRGRFQAV